MWTSQTYKLTQGLLVLTCWNCSRYYLWDTRTFSLSLRGNDGSEGGGEFASMIRSRRLGVLGSRTFLRIDLLCFVLFSDPLCLRFPLSATLVFLGSVKTSS